MEDEVIRLLSEKLDTSTEFVYRAMQQQVYVARITDALYYIVFIFVIYRYQRYLRWYLANRKGLDWDDDNSQIPLVLLGTAASFLCVMFIMASLAGVITAWVNPDAWIILKLLSEMK